ncbi:RNA-binding protein [Candidatus Woesearchaeota archaeon]|nr:RNA-binding protein [Candidatus Woesearchaeota archaeon]
MNKKRRLRKKAKALEPIIRIGKSGLTENLIKEIRRQLKKRKLIKIKLLRSAEERENRKKFAEEIAEKTGSELVHHVGFVVVLHKKQ